jgi:N-acetylmuramoyl-L-alanine amidase
VLAQGWPLLNPDSPTFADIPYGSTFYGHIETAVAHRIINGYPCGNPEPCDPQSRPYFRPNADVSRGQIAKIVVLAKGWQPQNPPNPTFADVMPGSAFYSFIETAAARGIVGGYPCGYPQPCDPQQRPYFRPANPATRGQIAKIVHNAIIAP